MSDKEIFKPKILVFSTEKISDPGIDLAGLMKMHYPPTVYTIVVPCSSSVKPKWIIHAFKKGMDGVFIAADGSDCAYRTDCSEMTANVIKAAQELMTSEKINISRLKMAAICSVCAEAFAKHMKEFYESLDKLGSIKNELGEANG